MHPGDRPRPARPASRGRRAAGGALVALIVGLTPGLAGAQNPLGPLPYTPPPTPTTNVPTTSPTSTSGGGLSSTEQIGLFAAGLLLIAGIAFLIRRDAHAAAPTKRPSSDAPRATVKPRAKRVEQSRARAKAARRQRKRSRAR